MPVARLTAKAQLGRLSEFPGRPRAPDGLNECVDVLAELARSADHCEAIVTRLARSMARFPLPVDIAHAAQAERTATEPEWAPEFRPRLPRTREDDWPDHPEIVAGIPARVVTGKTLAAREKAAREIGYNGPLTLVDAIEAGRVPEVEARRMVDAWERASGQRMLRA